MSKFPFSPSLFQTNSVPIVEKKFSMATLSLMCVKGMVAFCCFFFVAALEIKLYRMQFYLLYPSLSLLGKKKRSKNKRTECDPTKIKQPLCPAYGHFEK